MIQNVTISVNFDMGRMFKNAVRVCYELKRENKEREVRGLVETCKKFLGVKGVIVTFNQKDKISYGGMIVEIVPAVEFFGGES